MAEWVRWKCQYGCPLFEKDPFHPPFAPDAESTSKVLKEYTKAILLNGPDGQTLTEAVVKLEGEAYHRGDKVRRIDMFSLSWGLFLEKSSRRGHQRPTTGTGKPMASKTRSVTEPRREPKGDLGDLGFWPDSGGGSARRGKQPIVQINYW